ncbi:hypothetical protein [Mycoplasma yeatsii]|uniref:hypothetical protein n=1 Tax=Mycoplasma yeatsii TaxID=51365 RepID=UPI0005B3C4A1|nr:hypothetical protein [Mycoplasma yeatsii]
MQSAINTPSKDITWIVILRQKWRSKRYPITKNEIINKIATAFAEKNVSLSAILGPFPANNANEMKSISLPFYNIYLRINYSKIIIMIFFNKKRSLLKSLEY